MARNLHYNSYRPTEYNTDLIDDIFQCPNRHCSCQITGVRFAEIVNNPYHYMATCPNCSITYIKHFVQVNT